MERPYLCRKWLVEDARDKVLEALDAFTKESGLGLRMGAEDRDLQALFKGIDAHVDRLIERSGEQVPDEPHPEGVVEHARSLDAPKGIN